MALARRQVHLDFHTGPGIPDVAVDFDPESFAAQVAEARVQSVTLFAKCHHGHLYYETADPARHPGLGSRVLLEHQVEALQARGIRTPIYLSVQWDEYAAEAHPEWVATDATGKPRGPGPLEPGWRFLDMASPYADYLADQIADVLARFRPLDGLFLDIAMDMPSWSPWTRDGMRRAGLDFTSEQDHARFATSLTRQYMQRYREQVAAASPDGHVPVVFNGRPLWLLAQELDLVDHVEIEALPTGGWGYSYFPLMARWARGFDRPFLGMTARFHKSWADFGGYKPLAAMRYECAQAIAAGGACSIGDQLHPRGRLDPVAYSRIGRVFAEVEEMEPLATGAVPLADIAVVEPASSYFVESGGTAEGVLRVLQELHGQFDVVPRDADLTPYEVVVVPETVRLDEELEARLDAHVAGGGRVLLALRADTPAPRLAGVGDDGPSPHPVSFYRWTGDEGAVEQVVREPRRRIRAEATQVIAEAVQAYYDRTYDHFCSHHQTPPDRPTGEAVATVVGSVATVAFPLFASYASHGDVHYRDLASRLMDRLLPSPIVRVTAPSWVETSVLRQADRLVVHLLSFVGRRRTPTLDVVEEDAVALDVLVDLRAELLAAPAGVRVALARTGEPLSVRQEGDRLLVTVPVVRGHTVITVEPV